MVVTVKLPEFWPEAAHVWFVRADAEFAVKNVSVESTKFSYVVAALPESVALRVADALMDPDPSNPYPIPVFVLQGACCPRGSSGQR